MDEKATKKGLQYLRVHLAISRCNQQLDALAISLKRNDETFKELRKLAHGINTR